MKTSRQVLALAVVTFAFTTVASAAPKNAKLIGTASYKTMQLRGLAKPELLWQNDELVKQSGVDLLKDTAFASPVDGESANIYTNEKKTAYVDAYGGLGMNGNFGSGRAAIVGDWQIKGSGKTMMVNAKSDQYHRSGASTVREGVWEAAWGRLLAKELPFGAYQTLAVIATGSQASIHGTYFEPRVLIVREDPIRPAHFTLNPTMMEVDPAAEKARVADAMKTIVEALPKPKGYVSAGRQADFRAGVIEMIERQAVQHGYAWAHGLFHGGTSPSNTGLDGRALDFGSYSAFDRYPRARVMDEDGFFGEKEIYKRDFIKDIRDAWTQSLPMDLLAALPSEAELFQKFDDKFDQTRSTEMVRLAGAMDEFLASRAAVREVRVLGAKLITLAEAGNTKGIEVWKGESPWGQGQYKVGEILNVLAKLPVDAEKASASPELIQLVPNARSRFELTSAYEAAFEKQQAFASEYGITAESEATFRAEAAKLRNEKMTAMFRIQANEKLITEAIEQYKQTGDASAIQKRIDMMVESSRREYRDAAPFTIVMREKKVGDRVVREVFDAKAGKYKRMAARERAQVRPAPARDEKQNVRQPVTRAASSCKALFGK